MRFLHSSYFVRAVQFIYAHIDQPQLTVANIAAAVGISVSSLKRLFLEATDHSVGMFVRRLRMECAFRSLQNKEDLVVEIALSVGFEDHAAFARAFKQYFGHTPTLARNKLSIVSELTSICLAEPEIHEVQEMLYHGVTIPGGYATAAPQAWEALSHALTLNKEDTETLDRVEDDEFRVFIGVSHDYSHDNAVSENERRFFCRSCVFKPGSHLCFIAASCGDRYMAPTSPPDCRRMLCRVSLHGKAA